MPKKIKEQLNRSVNLNPEIKINFSTIAAKVTGTHLAILGALVATLVIVNVAALTISIKYGGRTFPGLKIAGQLSGGLSSEQLAGELQTRQDQFFQNKLTIEADGKAITIDPANLVIYEPQQTAEQALAVGRQGGIGRVWGERVGALTGNKDLKISYRLNEGKLNKVLGDLVNRIVVQAEDARIVVQDGKVQIEPGKEGVSVDIDQLRQAILENLGQMNSEPINLSVTKTQPKVTAQDLEAAKKETEAATASPVELTWSGRTWTIDATNIASLISYSTDEETLASAQVGGEKINVGRITKLTSGSNPTGNLQPHVHLDFSKLSVIIDPIVDEINKPATDPKLVFVDGKLQVAQGSGEGREVDAELLASKVTAALRDEGPKSIEIPVKVTQPGIDIAHLESLGIKELIGKGQSYYAGSIPGRNTNIAVAAAKVNGALIPPGQVFSLYKQIGEVTPEAGYVTSYVIIGHRTELGLGGGVCQVSTTLFRAALASGLPIVERHPHAYRVHYYEQNSGPGLDATVYFPSVDFKFRNDTGHYILIQTVNDPVAHSLAFEFYGTSDGRVTSISTPVVTNVQPAPPPLYEDDPTLPKGVTKQVDWAVEGADASFTRTVTRNGQVILNDTYYSKYAPWQAIYMVGTRG